MSANPNVLFLGIGGHAVAIDPATGTEIWRRKLKSQTYVTIAYDGHTLFAGCEGELFGLDPATGEIRWHNKLPKLGTGLISFGGTADPTVSASHQIAATAASLAAVTAATAATSAAT